MICRLIACGLLVWCIAAMVNAECTSSECYQGTSITLNCPPGTTQHDNYCFPDNICPVNTIFKNGFCEAINQEQDLLCPAPFILKDGVCLNEQLVQPCSSNSQNCIVDKNVQMQCGPSMINFNGGCAPQTVATCPYSTTLQNGLCTRVNTCTSNNCNSGNMACPIESTMVENTCVRNTPCNSQTTNINGACATCPYDKITEKTVCPPPVVTVVTVTQPPVITQPPVVIIQEPQIIRIVEKPVIVYMQPPSPLKRKPDQQAPPSNHVNKIDITNIVDNHNVHNVPTNINAVNINNIMLGSRALAVNINKHDRSHTHGEGSSLPVDESENFDEICCVIMEPRTCVPVGDKIKCYHRRHHKCGAECSEPGSDPSVLISYQQYIEKTDTPVEETTSDPLRDEKTDTPIEETTSDPLRDEITVAPVTYPATVPGTYPETVPGTYPETVPGTYPGHYPYPQFYPDQTNLYQGQTNQYPMIYPGQYNPYLTPNHGQPSPIPYSFSEGHNAGIPMSYPGQQYPMPFPYAGGQNTGVSFPYPGQPYAIPAPSDGVHNMEVPTSYLGQSNPVSYPYQDQSFGVSAPYQTGQNAYPSQYPSELSSAFSPTNCVQQQTWPFVNCAQNVKIDCNQCQQTRCHPMCY